MRQAAANVRFVHKSLIVKDKDYMDSISVCFYIYIYCICKFLILIFFFLGWEAVGQLKVDGPSHPNPISKIENLLRIKYYYVNTNNLKHLQPQII